MLFIVVQRRGIVAGEDEKGITLKSRKGVFWKKVRVNYQEVTLE